MGYSNTVLVDAHESLDIYRDKALFVGIRSYRQTSSGFWT